MTQPIVHIRVGKAGFTLPVGFQPLTIGRAADNAVHVKDSKVEDHHAIVLRKGDGVHVIDLGSKHGTKVNGKPVQDAKLGEGDVVKIGPMELRLAGMAPAPDPFDSDVADAIESPEDRVPAPTVAITAEDLREPPRQPVVRRSGDSGPIRVIPDPESDRPLYKPPPLTIDDLLLPRDLHHAVQSFLDRDAGLAIVCGPEGSGRTSTCYAMLRRLAARKRIVTFEQPPELQIEGAAQVFVHDTREYAPMFNRMLAGDPQVIFLGEPPPPAVITPALQAAVGRCLVVALVEANDCVEPVYDWLMKCAQPKLLASSLKLVICQRVVRRLCDNCKAPIPIEGEAQQKLGPFLSHVDRVYAADACPECNNTGYVGQIGIFEVLTVGDSLRAVLMTRHPTVKNLRDACDPKHLIPLHLSAYARVAQGLTTIEEADTAIASRVKR